MEIERLFVALALDAKEYTEGLNEATESGRSWGSSWGTIVSGAMAATFLVGIAVIIAGIASIGTAAFDIASQINDAGNQIQAELGTTAEEAAELADIAAEAWGNNFGGSIEEAKDVVVDLRREIGDLAGDELQRATENAFRLSDAFGVDTAESARAVGTLVEEFGLTADEAFDFLTVGFQRGLNQSDDFIDSIGEYSNLFADAGFDAEGFFSIMESGSAGGVLGTDKISDAIKEFGIIMNEESDDAAAALDTIGLSYDDMVDQVATGSATWADFFDDIVAGLNGIEDPLLRSQLQTDLFGTMAEDLGVSFTEGLTSAGLAIDEMAGATSQLDVQYQNLPAVIEGFKRRALLALRPIGDFLLEVANFVMPFVEQAFTQLEATIGPLLEQGAEAARQFFIAFQNGQTPLNQVVEVGRQLWQDVIVPLAARVQELVDRLGGWQQVLTVVVGVILATFIPTLLQIVAVVGLIIGIFVLVVEAAHWLLDMWEQDFLGIRTATLEGVEDLTEMISGFIDTAVELWETYGDDVIAFFEGVYEFMLEIFELFSLAYQGDWREFGEKLREIVDRLWEGIKQAFSDAWDAIRDFFLSGRAAELGQSIADGIASGLTAAASTIAEAARNAAAAALDAAKGFLGIDSPSRVMAELVGRPISQGIAAGMSDTRPIEAAMAGIADTLTGGDNRTFRTTINLPQGADPMRAIRASRHLDDLMASGATT